MFSGIISLDGEIINLPEKSDEFQSNQSYFLVLEFKDVVMFSKDLDFSRTPTTSPTFKV